MFAEMNDLVHLLNKARAESNDLNNTAFLLRQEAIRAQFEATSAAEIATITADLLNKSTNSDIAFLQLALACRQALRKTIQATGRAADAVERANEADHKVTNAFIKCRDAANRLTLVLDNLEILNRELESTS